MTSPAILRALVVFAHAVLLTALLGHWLKGQWPGPSPQPASDGPQVIWIT